MALDKVIQAILDEGKREAERIVAEGRKEAEKTLAEARKQGEHMIEEKQAEAEKLSKRMKVQETARAEIESKKLVLKAQKEFLDGVYQSALQRLSEQWSSKLIEATIDKNASEVKNGLVFSNERDGSMAERLARACGGKFGGTIDCMGGIVIESSDGSVRMDYRLETILKEIWDNSVIEVSSILWGKEGA
jgi:V/A-type H+-transporting ATPase subunit E